MTGMHKATGKTLSGTAHIAQSIGDILSTPVGTRVMRREYGSRLAELVDAPMNARTRLLIVAASAGAIRRWEPRVRIDRISVGKASADGALEIALTGHRTDIPAPLSLQLNLAL